MGLRRNWPSLRLRWHGALLLSGFGCLVAVPPELAESGVGWDVLLAATTGGISGAVIGFLFPTALRRPREARRPPPPPPPHPPLPPPPPPPGIRSPVDPKD